jgi:hypothetical protein
MRRTLPLPPPTQLARNCESARETETNLKPKSICSLPSVTLFCETKKTDPWTAPAYGNRRHWRAGARLRWGRRRWGRGRPWRRAAFGSPVVAYCSHAITPPTSRESRAHGKQSFREEHEGCLSARNEIFTDSVFAISWSYLKMFGLVHQLLEEILRISRTINSWESRAHGHGDGQQSNRFQPFRAEHAHSSPCINDSASTNQWPLDSAIY